jgi:hypothetical protein
MQYDFQKAECTPECDQKEFPGQLDDPLDEFPKQSQCFHYHCSHGISPLI